MVVPYRMQKLEIIGKGAKLLVKGQKIIKK